MYNYNSYTFLLLLQINKIAQYVISKRIYKPKYIKPYKKCNTFFISITLYKLLTVSDRYIIKYILNI